MTGFECREPRCQQSTLDGSYYCGDHDPDHVHEWGDLERSRFAGTVHRKCLVDGCRVINAYDDEEGE